MLDPHDKFTRVVPDNVQRPAPLTADERLSTFTANYGAGFPESAQIAFQSAVDIWQTQVSSPITIVIDANWVDFGDALPSRGTKTNAAIPRNGVGTWTTV
jgi:hypothetical protein